MSTTSLPYNQIPSTDTEMKTFFNQYYTQSTSYPSNQIDAVVGFFEKRGFDKIGAVSVATVLLQQAKTDNVNVFTLLETLNGQSDVQISALIAQILNSNRSATSTLGYKIETIDDLLESRNILV